MTQIPTPEIFVIFSSEIPFFFVLLFAFSEEQKSCENGPLQKGAKTSPLGIINNIIKKVILLKNDGNWIVGQ